MIVLGILDNAFELEFQTIEQVFMVRVDPHRTTSRLRWKKSWENKPIFRQAIATADGIGTSDKPIPYHTFLYYIQRLGFMAGMMQIFNPYNIRRGTGEAVDAIATQAQLQQVMGHKDAGVYQAYINERISCDVQAAFLGRPSANALMKSLTHVGRDIDPRAPKAVADMTNDSLKTHPLVVELRQQRDALSKETRELYGTLKNA